MPRRPPRWSPALAVVAIAGLTACKESFTGRDWSVCYKEPCQVGYVCLEHRCFKGDGGEDPITRYPGWDRDGGIVDGGADHGGSPGQDARLDAPSRCGMDSECPAFAPLCLAGRCSKCGQDGDCGGRGGPACDVSSGRCVQCTEPARHCTADPRRAFCVASVCVGCQGAGAGACKGATPVCDASSGRCVQCTEPAQHCTADPARAFCVGNACVGCQAGGPGACRGTTPACDSSSGICVQCTGPEHCTADPAKPFCVNRMCAGCAAAGGNSACASRDGGRAPVCASNGACVECLASSDCREGGKPICDTASMRCQPCTTDAQCAMKGSGPGVCMFHQDGRCAAEAETIYVQKVANCGAAGTAATPLCSPQEAPSLLSTSRRVVVIRGPVGGGGSWTLSGTQVSVVGQQSGTIAPGTDPGIRLSGGDLYVRNVTVTGSFDVGIIARSGTVLRLDRLTVRNCEGGGLLLDGAGFDVRNSTFQGNGPGLSGTTSWGGILVLSPASPARLERVTIQDNKQVGLTCSAAIMGTGVFASGNAGGVDVTSPCGITSCPMTGPSCGAP